MILPSDELKKLPKLILEQEIKVFDFASVVSEKKMKGSGLVRGQEVFVMSTKDVATLKSDPYLKRTFVIVAQVEDGKPQIPKADNDAQGYVVDPRNLQKITGDREKELKDALEQR